ALPISEWPEVHEAAEKAEAHVRVDPRTACFYARRTLELAVAWMYEHDADLRQPYQEQLAALIHEPTFRQTVGPAVFGKAQVIKSLGNQAVHSRRAMHEPEAMAAVRELFHICFWLARTYAREAPPPDGLAFDTARLPVG